MIIDRLRTTLGGKHVPITLRAAGFTLVMDELRDGDPEDDACRECFRGEVLLQSSVPEADRSIKASVDFFVTDLQRLCDWMDRHVGALVARVSDDGVSGTSEDRTWVPADLSMQIQLQEGDVDREDEILVGEFGVCVLINVGRDPETRNSIYSGFQGAVDVRSTFAFCADVREYVAGKTRG